MSSTTQPSRGRRVAERPPSRWRAPRLGTLALAAWWGLVALSGCVALGLATVEVGPEWLDGAGAVAVVTAASWALAARTGGRTLVAAGLALALGLVAIVVGGDVLRTGAAVLTATVVSVLAVVVTVPARGYLVAVREAGIATLVAAVGGFAALGFEPALRVTRFEYASLVLALLLVFAIVHRLGAGLHGLGRRGLVVVVVGAALLVITMAYAELLRLYAVPGLMRGVLDLVSGTREAIGAFPQPVAVLLGVPALAWGCHMRARRRQGWWVCAFGVAATMSVVHPLVDPRTPLLEAGLKGGYSLALGLALGYLLVRADLHFTGPRGRRARRAEQAAAHRPEPSRFEAL